ncbi:MAG: hypothetical protein KJ613_01665 [Nanoarchaeota archaeon]|nr:hypothetical protein [Nanoarchaeota archaeon]
MKNLLFLSMLFFFLIGCGGSGGVAPPPGGNGDLNGQVNLPTNIEGASVFAGLETGIVSNNNFSLKTKPNRTQVIPCIHNGNLVGLSTILNTSNETNVNMTPRSTAESLLLLVPFSAQGTMDRDTAVMNIIKSTPEVYLLENAVKNSISSKGFVDPDDAAFQQAFKNAVEAVGSEVSRQGYSWEINPNKSSGFEVLDIGAGKLEFVNYYKRHVDAYKKISGYSIVASVTSIGLSGLYQPVHKQISLTETSDFEIVAYGPGIGNIPEIGSADFDRFLAPTIRSLIFDAILPSVNLIFGISGIDNFGVAENLVEMIMSDKGFIGGLLMKIGNEDYFGVAVSLMFKSVNVLVDDVVTNGPNSILVKYIGSNAAVSVLENVLLPLKVLGIALKALDVSLTVSAYVNSNAVEHFSLKPTVVIPSQDTTPPVWDNHVGIYDVLESNENLIISWGCATDEKSSPVEYLIYIDTDNNPWDQESVVCSWCNPGHEYYDSFQGLVNGQTYWFGVRCRDSASPPNVDTNTVILSATPSVGVGDDIVNFLDSNLEQAIRDAIGKPSGDIVKNDLTGLTVLSAEGLNITNLEGLQYCTDLKNLYMNVNNVVDISPLENLNNLLFIALGDNRISNLSSLSGLAGLKELYLHGNQIVDISPLENLVNLTRLQLMSNQIVDITALQNLHSLVFLDLQDNKVENIYSLQFLPMLNVVMLSYNQIKDINPLVMNGGLGINDTIYLKGNPLSDASKNVYIPELEAREVDVVYDP